MALSDDIKQLVRREQNIQGVIGLLDTYLTDKQTRRDNYKPIKADKPKYYEHKTKDAKGNISTQLITEEEYLKLGKHVTTEAEVKEDEVVAPKKSDFTYFTPNKDIELPDGTIYKENTKVSIPITEAHRLQNEGSGTIILSTTTPKADKPKEIGDLNKVDQKQFQRYEAFTKEINKNLGTKLHPISGSPINIYKELISKDSKYAEDIINSPQVKKIQANNTLSKDEKEEKIFKWVLQNYVFKGRPQDYKDYINYEAKFRPLFDVEEAPVEEVSAEDNGSVGKVDYSYEDHSAGKFDDDIKRINDMRGWYKLDYASASDDDIIDMFIRQVDDAKSNRLYWEEPKQYGGGGNPDAGYWEGMKPDDITWGKHHQYSLLDEIEKRGIDIEGGGPTGGWKFADAFDPAIIAEHPLFKDSGGTFNWVD